MVSTIDTLRIGANIDNPYGAGSEHLLPKSVFHEHPHGVSNEHLLERCPRWTPM